MSLLNLLDRVFKPRAGVTDHETRGLEQRLARML